MRIKKRLFLGLLVMSLVFIILTLLGVWYILAHRSAIWTKFLLFLGAFTLAGFFFFLILGVGGLALILWRHHPLPFLQQMGISVANLLFPLAVMLGKRLGISSDTVRASFIEINNQLVRMQKTRVKPEEILLLAPHCLQRSDCPHKITADVYNCRRCGRCSIHILLDLADRYGVRLAVATGGTLARHFVKIYRPRVVVAIACERDLTSGIQDTQPLPVWGIVNLRPYGPCLNTQVEVTKVEEALCFFLGLEAQLPQQADYQYLQGSRSII
ncbi:MAG: DUF116 domain-containing protein [Thermanaeromonas sp.]|uniref:DUF116 domain-containing protein n=1 Tax=Thermanaeromonas sp. TaxID=2003697 RepID=UPI00243D2287|nr:DUF116 domain-containing protein [Thermanaeromonas sp.]MCG0276932.1 DUF116 domain-containing protein [Thermanaeromonas sp.]